MLQGLLMVLLVAASFGLVYLAYGKKGMEAKKALGQKVVFPIIVFAIVMIFYALLIGLWKMEAKNDWYEYAFLIGVPVGYILYIVRARVWTKKALVLLEEQRQEELAQKRAKEEKKRQEEKRLQERELEKKQIEQSMARAFSDNSGTASDFVQRAAACKTFAQMLAVWDSINAAENGTNEVIRNEIVAMVRTERMYGSTPRELNQFLEKFQQKFSEAVIEVKEVEEEPVKEPLKGTAAFNAFIEEAKQGKRFSEMLAMWKELDIENPAVHEEVMTELTSLAKAERIYGGSAREYNAFLSKLVKKYGSSEAE